MDFFDILFWVEDQLIRLMTWVMRLITQLWNVMMTLVNFLLQVVGTVFRAVWRGLSALVHLRWGDIWRWLKKQWERLKRYRRWWEDHVQAPIDRIRRNIMSLYDTFFKPIVRAIDSVRVFARFVGIFNRRLAAKIDGALFRLEAKVMWPITAMLKRVNEISSWQRAIFTRLGMLDRVLLIESLRRDAGIVWEVLTNPRARIYGPIAHPPARGVHDMVQDAKDFYRYGTGAYAQDVMDLQETFRKTVMEIE